MAGRVRCAWWYGLGFLVLCCLPVCRAQGILSAYQFGLSPLVVPASVPVGTVVAVTRVPMGSVLPDCLRTETGVCQLTMKGPEMLKTNIAGLSVRVEAVERDAGVFPGERDEADFQPYHARVKTAMTGGYRVALVKTGAMTGGFLREVAGEFVFEYQRPVLPGGGLQAVFTERLRYQGYRPVRVEDDSTLPVCPGGRASPDCDTGIQPVAGEHATGHRVS